MKQIQDQILEWMKGLSKEGVIRAECASWWVQALASRVHSQTMLNVLQPTLPGLIGGSADLAPSNLTIMKVHLKCHHCTC